MILLQGLARAITCGTRALLMENQSAQNRREFKREYFVLAAAFQREPLFLSNLPSGAENLYSKRAPAMYFAQRRLDCRDMIACKISTGNEATPDF